MGADEQGGMADLELKARILKGVGGQFWIADGATLIGVATARGILRRRNHSPLPGDEVIYSSTGDPDVPWVIDRIFPRRNHLIRPPVANLDGMVITLSADQPAPDYYLADKLLTICRHHQIEPLICLTKVDLAAEVPPIRSIYEPAGCRVVLTHPEEDDSLDILRRWMRGRIISFAGQSGVGKSTLLNRLFDREMMITGGLSEKAGRGRHTTRHVELFPHDDGYIADTPGFSMLELSDFAINGTDLVHGYPEIEAIEEHCRFTGCRHLGEMGCAVRDSSIHPDRLERYRYFRRQLDSIDPYAAGKPQIRH